MAMSLHALAVETFVPILLEQNDEGHIVNTASMAGLVGMRWLGVYSAAKFAVVGLSEALYRELKPRGIGVSVLCPMIVSTNINENSVRMRPAEMRNPQEAPVPDSSLMAGAVISPDEVARRVLRGISLRLGNTARTMAGGSRHAGSTRASSPLAI